jgi:hypothetical protein
MKRAMLVGIVAVTMLAQAPSPATPQDLGDDGASPEHGVARLSLIQGNVSVRHGDAGDLTAGVMNAPLLATDRVATGDGSRAEIQFDGLNMVRLNSNTEVRLSELQYKQDQVQVAQGTVMFHVVRDNDVRAEISTPTVLVRPAKAGNYRITVNTDGTSEIGVRSGQAEILGPKGSEFLNSGQTMFARGSASDPEVQVIPTGLLDEFDRWNSDRDRAFENSVSGRYVSPDVSGAEALDQYGRWQNDPQYGNVWVPSQSAGWAPYQDGRWVYADYYGWSWLGAEPWGWAPYHYGYWYSSPWGWAWWPGVYGPAYYWRPAMVGFFGWGSGHGWGVGFGFANVGWVALAPHEHYHPWYGHGYGGYGGYNRTTIVNNVNIVNNYRNARYNNAVSGVRASDFGRTPVTRGNLVRASSGDLARAGSVQGAMPFTPAQNSRRFSDAAVSTRGMPQTRSNLSFAQGGSRSEFQRGGASTPGFVNRGVPAQSQVTPSQPRGGAGGPGNGGWRPFDPSNGRQNNNQPRGYTGTPPAAPNRSFDRPGDQPAARQPSYSQPPNNNQPRGYAGTPPAAPNRTFDQQADRPAARQPGYTQQPNYNQPRGFAGAAPQERQPNFNQPRSYPPPPQAAPQQRAPQRYAAPQYSQPAPRGNGGGFGAPQRLQINPPIVRERGPSSGAPAPHAGGGGRPSGPSGGGGGNARSGGGGGGRGHR